MKISEGKSEIFKAIASFRKALKQPLKDADNPFFNSKYVPLENIVEVIDEAIQGTGLSYTQEITFAENKVSVATWIFHESGQYIEYEPFDVMTKKTDAQGQGSAASYGRRYTLSAAFGITSDADDDGNEASNNNASSDKKKRTAPKLIDGKQLANLNEEARKVAELAGAELSLIQNKLAESANIHTLDQLPANLYSSAMAKLIKWKQGYEKNAQESKSAEQKQNDINWGNAQ